MELKKYKVYPEYKDSGVEWIGEIPGGWELGQIKRDYEVCLGKMIQPEPQTPNDTLEYYLRSVNVQDGYIDISNIKQMWFSKSEKKRYKLQKDDLIVCEGGEVGRSALWEGWINDCYIQNAVHRIRGKKGKLTNFLRYWMRFMKNSGFIDLLCNKATILHLTEEKVKGLPLLVVPNFEQNQIASFLDHKTTRIDQLIQEKQELIELLKKKKTALITKCVTKGLDDNVKMKDSGVEWIGEVPEGWGILQLKRVVRLNSGSMINSFNIEDNGDFPVMGGNGLRGYTSKYTHNGDYILIGRQGALCGNINYVYGKFWASEHAVVAHPLKEFSNIWLGELLRIMNLNQYSISAAQPGLSVERIGNALIPFPNLLEQNQIATFLDRKTAQIDQAIQETEESIELLKKYKTSLITNAVTGKIDVRDWTPESQNHKESAHAES